MNDLTKKIETPTSSPATASERSLVGHRIGVFEILEQVGKGGMGIVYRAKDKSLDRDVALKVLLSSLASDPEFEKRFVREARAAAKLDHPNIVATYTAGRYENTLFIAMQFVKGKTLHDLQKERKTFEPVESLKIIRQCAEALQAAHGEGLVHRDIKPNNIMLDESGRVKVMDFGLMRSAAPDQSITQTGIFFGTPEYASPEQCETKNVDARTDIYSLGAVLYEMLTGRIPHVADTPLALFKKISEEVPEPVRRSNPAVSKPVERMVERMMAKKRDDRYESCTQLIADIDAALAGGAPATTRTAVHGSRIPAVAACVIIAAACIVGWALWSKSSSAGAPSTTAPKLQNPTLVVFDFRNGTNDADTGWYEIALSDMLIAGLAQKSPAKVPTRDQLLWKVKDLSLGDKVTDANQRQLLARMGASFYLSGKYYVKAQKIRVTLTCYRAGSDEPAFPQMTFERLESEVFALVDEITAAVCRGLDNVAEPSVSPGATGARSATNSADLTMAKLRSGEDGQKADQEKAKRDKNAEPPKTPAPGQRPRPEEKRHSGNLPALSDVERARHWYANQQLAERCGAEEEDVKLLLKDLQEKFQVDPEDVEHLQKSIENFRRCVKEAGEAKKAGVKKLIDVVDYCCADCSVDQKDAGPCPKCKAPMMMRITVHQVDEKKK